MSEAESTVTITEATEAVSEMAGGAIVPMPAESVPALLACGYIVQQMIYRAWEGLENPNAQLLAMAAGYGLMVDREPTEDELASGEFTPDDVVMMLSPAFDQTMEGLSETIEAFVEEEAARDQQPILPEAKP